MSQCDALAAGGKISPSLVVTSPASRYMQHNACFVAQERDVPSKLAQSWLPAAFLPASSAHL